MVCVERPAFEQWVSSNIDLRLRNRETMATEQNWMLQSVTKWKLYHPPQQRELEEERGGVPQLIVRKGIDEIGLMLSQVHLQIKPGVGIDFKCSRRRKKRGKCGRQVRREEGRKANMAGAGDGDVGQTKIRTVDNCRRRMMDTWPFIIILFLLSCILSFLTTKC